MSFSAIEIAAALGAPAFVNGGVLWGRTNRDSAVDALTAWANDCERKLLGLHCGQVLERSRHAAWAKEAIGRCKFLMVPGDNSGAILTPWFLLPAPLEQESVR